MIKKVAKGYYQWDGLDLVKDYVGSIDIFDHLTENYIQDKTLSCMTSSFISLIKTRNTMSLEKMGEILSNNNSMNLKSKMRRLYDICKVLTAIGLIASTQDSKRSTNIKWLGAANIVKVVQPLLQNKNVKLKIDKQNFKLQKIKSSIFKNISKILDEKFKIDTQDVINKRRTSSFDITIMDKFLKKNNTIILPKVNLPNINLNQ
jgi:hypothetical protein